MTQTETSRAYQVLFEGEAVAGNKQWPLPEARQPGDWIEIGYEDLIQEPAKHWRDGAKVYVLEYESVEGVLKARLVKQVPTKELAEHRIYITGNHTVDSGTVAVSGDAVVESSEGAVVWASGNSKVRARGRGVVRASGSATVEAFDRVRITAKDKTVINARGRSHVEARAHAQVFAYDQATVEAGDGAIIRGYKMSNIIGRGTCRIFTFDNAAAIAHDRCEVVADGSSLIRAADTVKVTRKGANVQIHPLFG